MMQAEMSVTGTARETKSNWRSQYQEHLAQQPEKVQAIHCWLGRLTAAGLGLVVGLFAMALYVSVNWKQALPQEIAVRWILFAASGLPAAVFTGLDTIVLRAMGPVGKDKTFVTGTWAVVAGWGTIAAGLAWSALLVYLAYGVATLRFDMVEIAINSLTPVFTAAILVSIAYSVVRDLTRRLGTRS
jgi:hypothetical protein